jgi:hypothetical protein
MGDGKMIVKNFFTALSSTDGIQKKKIITRTFFAFSIFRFPTMQSRFDILIIFSLLLEFFHLIHTQE